ncbi:putative sterol carrier protein [Longilinea arvoryzae]|uniref:Putative sterol carrier protein n=1 Tax=Longilinea arvoryzae TaxID=360412 RepID=A0A0S7BH83_9CHLR|nr:SCP2 sterol-binding domain-containing protein [Longilinea arvoryzae]GAP14953.1 putative sterol carrier protein [Longilinea arvoryzae]
MSDVPLQKLFNALPRAFIPEKASGIDAITHFALSGEKGGDWTVTIQDQKISVVAGLPPESPTLTLHADAQDILDIFSGKLDITRAYMQGKLRVTGNFGLAYKLSTLFRVDEELFRSLQ